MFINFIPRLIAPTLGIGALFCFQLACTLPVLSQHEIDRELDQAEVELRCGIEAETTRMKVGQTPDIRVSIKNEGEDTVKLVGSLDASDCRWRFPHCYFEIEGPEGYKPPSIGRCGNMNTLRKEDFVDLESGHSFDPYQSIDGHGFFGCFQLSEQTFTMPGEYKITFVYSTKSNKLEEWMGDPFPKRSEEVSELWREVPQLELRSNTVTFVVD